MVPKDCWKIELDRTALVTIDIQQTFLEPGSPVECARARGIVGKVNELAGICRKAGLPVIHVRGVLRSDLSDIGLLQDIRPRTGSEFEYLEGRKGAEFYKDLEVKEGDYDVKKIRYSAFIPGSSNLETLLRGLGRDSFIVCGGSVTVCLSATTIDAMMLGFKVFVVGDLTYNLSEEQQDVMLKILDRHFAKVMTFEGVQQEFSQLGVNVK